MLLSREYTRIRLAALPEHIVEDFVGRYRYVRKDDGTDLNAEDVRGVEAAMEQAVPGKGGLATQWALFTLSDGSGRLPTSTDDLVSQAVWYFTHYKEPLFKEAVKNFNEEWGSDVNPKNMLDFTGSTMGYIIEEYEILEQASRVNKLPDELPEGSELFYDDGAYQIVEVSDPEAACELSQGSKWCTKEEHTAEGYLMDSPLYVIYRNRVKAAQLHLGAPGSSASNIELKNLRNRSFTPEAGIRDALIKSGIMATILKRLEGSNDAERRFLRLAGNQADPELAALCARYPKVSFIYAGNVLHGRFPEGEKAIARQPLMAISYARKFIKGRFPAAEPKIFEMRYEMEYAKMLQEVNPQEFQEFVSENPDVQEYYKRWENPQT